MNSWWAASNVLSLQKEETELHSFSKLEYGWRNSRSLVAWLRLSLFTFVFHLCPSLSPSFYHQRPFAQLYFICSRTHCTNKDCGLWSFFWKRDVLVLCSYYYRVRKTHCCYRYSLTTHFHPTAPKPHQNPHVKPFLFGDFVLIRSNEIIIQRRTVDVFFYDISKKVPGSNLPSSWDLSVRGLHVSPCVHVGFLWVLWRPPDMHIRVNWWMQWFQTGCICLSLSGCLSFCVSPFIVWRPAQGLPSLSPN